MKKIFAILLAAIMLLSFVACSGNGGGQTANVTPEPTEAAPASETDKLNELEKMVFDALIIMTTESFYEPSAVKVMQVGDYSGLTRYRDDDLLYGPDTIVVRLQGENRVGGTLNHFYKICIRDAENTSEFAQRALKWANDKAYILTKKGKIGDYADLGDEYVIQEEASSESSIGISLDFGDDIKVSVGNINKALKEYWDSMGF